MLVVYHKPKYLRMDLKKERSFRAIRGNRFNLLVRKKYGIESINYTFYNDIDDLTPFVLKNLYSDDKPIEKILRIKDMNMMKSFLIKTSFSKEKFTNKDRKINFRSIHIWLTNYLINNQVLKVSIDEIKKEYNNFKNEHLDEIIENKRIDGLEPISHILLCELNNLMEEIV